MKKYLILLAGSLLCVATAAAASPSPQHDDRGQQDDQDWHGNHGNHGNQDKHDRGDNGRDRRDRDDHGDHGRGHDRDREVRYDRYDRDDHRGYYVSHDRGRHEGWYKRGGYVPVEYRDRRYEVEDWQVYHLRQPPYGYRYVRGDDGQFLLVAIASGIIADILLSH